MDSEVGSFPDIAMDGSSEIQVKFSTGICRDGSFEVREE